MTVRALFSSLRERDRRALRLGASMLGPLFFLLVVARPLAAVIRSSREAMFAERDRLAREQQLLAEMSRDRHLVDAARSALRTAEPRLFPGRDVVTASAEMARYISTAATTHDLVVEQAETETALDSAMHDGRDSSLYRDLLVTLRARGDIASIVGFLAAVEAGERSVRPLHVRIGSEAGDGLPTSDELTLAVTFAGVARGSDKDMVTRITRGEGTP